MKKLYEKSKIWFSVVWIVIYCLLLSAADALSASFGVEKSVTLAVALALSLTLLFFLYKNGLMHEYGLCRPEGSLRSVLFYLPLLLLLSANLWFGVAQNFSAPETVLYILSMLCVGFLEEVIFRGLLLKAMLEEHPRAAVTVSSLTFGIGHIINLINGSGAALLENLLQVVYATAAGFMFVMLFLKTKSLLVCIAVHGVFNALSAFGAAPQTTAQHLLSSLALTAICASYAAYLAFSIRRGETYRKS